MTDLLRTELVTAPSVEPLSLGTVRNHLRIDSQSFEDDISEIQSIKPDAWPRASSAWDNVGAAADVLGYDAMMLFNCGTIGAGGTVKVKLQESDTSSAGFVDVSGSTFTITPSTDEAMYEYEYTGGKQWVRARADTTGNAADFAVTILRNAPTGADDTLLNALIKTVRKNVENYLGRKLIKQTWKYYLDEYPNIDYIEMPYPPFRGTSSTSTGIVITDSTKGTTTPPSTTYVFDKKREPGRIVLDYNAVWPTSVTLHNVNPIAIKFCCGYGTASSDVPEPIKQAMLIEIANLYENRDDITAQGLVKNYVARSLLAPYRIYKF